MTVWGNVSIITPESLRARNILGVIELGRVVWHLSWDDESGNGNRIAERNVEAGNVPNMHGRIQYHALARTFARSLWKLTAVSVAFL